MFHELVTTIQIETRAKDTHVLIASTLSSKTKNYIKSKQPVGNPPPPPTRLYGGGYTYTLKFTVTIYHSSASPFSFPPTHSFKLVLDLLG